MDFLLTGGKFTKIDDDDLSKLSGNRWYCNNHGYAMRCSRKRVSLHRLVMGAPDGFDVDHINGDTLDNRKSNLRICSRSQNMANRKTNKNNKTGYKGVCLDNGRIRAFIKKGGRKMHLGMFGSLESAARAYDAAAMLYFGEYAKTNFHDYDV